MASIQRLCSSGVLLNQGMVLYKGTVEEAISRYLNNQIIQSEYINHQPRSEDKLNLLYARVAPKNNSTFYTSSPIEIDIRVRINDVVRFLVIGFNVMSSFQYPIARADYNDFNGLLSLERGEYEFHFEIPANTLSNGDYRIELDVAEKDVNNYAGDETQLSFRVDVDETIKVNAFNETMNIKTSIIREKWLVSYKKMQ